MKPFDYLCKSQGSLDMSHPVKVDPEDHGLIFQDEPLHVELLILEHLHGDIDDPHFEAVALQIFGEADKPDGIHLEDWRRGDDIADRTMDSGPLSEVVKGRGMQKDEIDTWHLHHFGEAGPPAVWVLAL